MADEYEYETRVLPMDEVLSNALTALEAEGWVIQPDTTPQIEYKLVRVKQPFKPQGPARGVLRIDETKVFVMAPDGTVRQ